MNRSVAHKILNAAQAGDDVSVATITQCLLATGDLDAVQHLAKSPTAPRTAGEIHRILLDNARSLLRQHEADDVVDAYALEWSEIILRQNPRREASA